MERRKFNYYHLMKSRWKSHSYLKVDMKREKNGHLAYSTMVLDDENHNALSSQSLIKHQTFVK